MRPLIHSSTVEISKAINRKISDEIFPIASTNLEDLYFQENPAPDYLEYLITETKNFVLKHKNEPTVLITSGGTTVPLENNTVRFIDNFSAGTRGAISAEYFLLNNYNVIFLYREFSITPFNSIFTHNYKYLFLDYFNEDGLIKGDFKEQISEKKNLSEKFTDNLLVLPFTTVNQYIWSLKSITKLMNNTHCIFYLAAAVSDFFVPYSRLPTHKIQSGEYSKSLKQKTNDPDDPQSNASTTKEGKLVLNLEPVPKFLKRIVESWAPKAMLVSFKLETDSSLLLSKCHQALEKYGHQLVIGNLLQTRNKQVVFVTNENPDGKVISSNHSEDATHKLESPIILEVIKIHNSWISTHN